MSFVSKTYTSDVNNTTTSLKNSHSVKPPSFNGDGTQFSWWKNKMYSYITLLDDELWDFVEDGTCFEVDEEGMVANRKKLTATQKKIYKRHHKVIGIQVDVLPHN